MVATVGPGACARLPGRRIVDLLAPCDAKERQQTTPRKTCSPWEAPLSFDIDNIRPTPTTDDRRQPRQPPAQVSIAIAGHDDLDKRRHNDHGRPLFSPHLDSATHLGMPARPPVARQPMHSVGGFVDLTRSARIASPPTSNDRRRPGIPNTSLDIITETLEFASRRLRRRPSIVPAALPAIPPNASPRPTTNPDINTTHGRTTLVAAQRRI